MRRGADTSRVFGIFWKCARVGERLSPYVSICCFLMAVSSLMILDEEDTHCSITQCSIFFGG